MYVYRKTNEHVVASMLVLSTFMRLCTQILHARTYAEDRSLALSSSEFALCEAQTGHVPSQVSLLLHLTKSRSLLGGSRNAGLLL